MTLKKDNVIIIKKIKLANTYFKRFIGLMFENKKKFNYALIFSFPKESRISCSLHMLFVFYPINVIFLDSNKRIVDIKTNFKPFTMYSTSKKCRYLIELPEKIDKKYYSLGNSINW